MKQTLKKTWSNLAHYNDVQTWIVKMSWEGHFLLLPPPVRFVASACHDIYYQHARCSVRQTSVGVTEHGVSEAWSAHVSQTCVSGDRTYVTMQSRARRNDSRGGISDDLFNCLE